jgi:hypothetical protein
VYETAEELDRLQLLLDESAARAAEQSPTTARSGPVEPRYDQLDSVSCTSPTFCAAVDYNGNVFTFNGKTWSTPVSIDPEPVLGVDSVSYTSSSFCAAVDDYGNALIGND